MPRSTIIATFLLLFVCPVFGQGQWSPFVTAIDSNPPTGAAFLNSQYGFVSTKLGTYRTTDGGKNWTHTNLLGSIGKNQFYFYTPSNIFFHGELESTDSGMTWRPLLQPAEEQLYIKNGVFFDASGRISFNHARSWRVIDSNYISGETIAGNLDSSIAIWGGSAFGNDSTLYTTDLGRTWHYGEAGIEADFGYAIPFSKTYFRAGGDGTDAIEKSTDAGATWQTVFGPIDWQYLSDGLAADGCVLYAQTMDTTGKYPPGLLRSTDQGTSWLAIGGPVNKDDYPLCGAVSRGAACFAMGYHYGDPVYKYIDSSLLRPILSDVTITRSFPDTIFMNECDSAKIKLAVSFSSCDFIRFQNLKVDSIPAKNYRLTYKPGNFLRDGHPDSASLTLKSFAAGTYTLNIRLSFSAMDWSPSDTTLPVILVIAPNPPILEIDHPDTINFGTTEFCNGGSTKDIHLTNLSCYSLKVTRILLQMDSLAKYDFTASMPANYILKEGIGSGKITVKFAPQSAGIKTGKLIIFTSIGNDTLSIIANVLPPPKTLAVESDVLTASLCGSGDGFIRFYNKSCRFMQLDSIDIPQPFQILPVRFPVYLYSGDSAILPVRFSPSVRGMTSANIKAHLSFYLPFESEYFDTIVQITATGTRGPSAYTLSENQIDFDTLRLCEGTLKKRIMLYSTGCDSLLLRTISLFGDKDFTLSESGKRELATGDSIALDITVDPLSQGNKAGFIMIIKNDNTPIAIPISAPIKRAWRILSSPVMAFDLGAQHTCENSDTMVTVTNKSCDTVHISGTSFQGSGFGTDTKFPFSLLPGESKQVHIFSFLDTAGGRRSNSSSMTYLSNADNLLAPITFSRKYLDPHSVHLRLDAQKSSLTSGEVWYVKLKADPAELSDITTINYSLDYNSDLLEFLPDLSPASSPDGKTFSISGNPNFAVDLDSAIALMEFAVYLTKDTATSVTLQNISLNSYSPTFMGCMATPLASRESFVFTYQNTCGNSHLRDLMFHNPIRFSINPNPVKEQIVIFADSPFENQTRIEIFDGLGKKIYSGIASPGTSKISIDSRHFPSGIYQLRLISNSQNSSGEFIKVE